MYQDAVGAIPVGPCRSSKKTSLEFRVTRRQEVSQKQHEYKLVYEKDDPKALQFLENLRSFLISQRTFLLRLLENPNLLEQESFTEQLWAVFHVADELQYRPDLAHLPGGDYRHLALDAGRAYSALTSEWLKYMAHLLKRYPYLFSLALRTNPFDPTASPVITDAG